MSVCALAERESPRGFGGARSYDPGNMARNAFFGGAQWLTLHNIIPGAGAGVPDLCSTPNPLTL